mgnify:CR=1 FL=1
MPFQLALTLGSKFLSSAKANKNRLLFSMSPPWPFFCNFFSGFFRSILHRVYL